MSLEKKLLLSMGFFSERKPNVMNWCQTRQNIDQKFKWAGVKEEHFWIVSWLLYHWRWIAHACCVHIIITPQSKICELALLTGEGSHRRHQSASQSIASEMAFSHRELHAIFLENCLPFQLSVNQQMLQSVPYHGGVNLNQRTADSSTLLHMVG